MWPDVCERHRGGTQNDFLNDAKEAAARLSEQEYIQKHRQKIFSSWLISGKFCLYLKMAILGKLIILYWEHSTDWSRCD